MTRFLTTFVVAMLVIAGCSISVDESAQVIDQDELPEVLRRATTTTVPTTVPGEDEREVEYYLLRSIPDVEQLVVEISRRRVLDTGFLDDFIRPMFDEGFATAEAEEGLINQLPNFVLEQALLPQGSSTAIVTLSFEGEAPNREITKDVAAQLVFTLTAFEPVDSIQVQIGDEIQALPTTDDEAGDVTRPVDRDDYERYSPDFVPETTTTTEAPPTTSLATTSTVPSTTSIVE